MERKIIHVDQNSFFASVEMKNNPSLRSVPMAVGGDIEQRHGIILAKNALASAYGVKTAEVIWQAKQKCPELVVVPGHYDQYSYYSRKAFEMYCQYTDRVEPYGIDECWLDVTDILGIKDHKNLADEIRNRVKNELGLTCSVGVSFNKAFAKLGSDYKKPDATTVITADNFKNIVWPLPVSDLLFVGHSTTKRLLKINIKTIGQLANLPHDYMRKCFGKNGELLWAYANGLDESPVSLSTDHPVVKSIGNSATTARDMACIDDIWKTIVMLSDQVATRLRKHGLVCNAIQIHVRDSDLNVFERQQRLVTPTDFSGEISRISVDLFRRNYMWDRSVRSIGVRAIQLQSSACARQISIFDPSFQTDQNTELEKVIDTIRLRFGDKSIVKGIELDSQHDLLPSGQFGWNNGGFSR